MRLLRAQDRVETPWKNGGGLTREVIVYPDETDLDTFEWRVSIAEVRTSTAFSPFINVDRCLAVLDGRMSLGMGAAAPLELNPESKPIAFPGEVPAHAIPLDGPVTDLNLMTRRKKYRGTLMRRDLGPQDRIETHAPVSLLIPRAAIKIEHAHGVCYLSALDAAMMNSPSSLRITPAKPEPTPCYLIELYKDL